MLVDDETGPAEGDTGSSALCDADVVGRVLDD